MELSKRNQAVLRFLKLSNLAVIFLFFISGLILLMVNHQMGEVFLYGALLMMATTPMIRTLLLAWLYYQEKRQALAMISLMTILLVLISSVLTVF